MFLRSARGDTVSKKERLDKQKEKLGEAGRTGGKAGQKIKDA
jgi:hypothetical protein